MKVDARGLSCPQPVLEAKKAIDRSDSTPIEIMVDNATAKNNVIRFAKSKGWSESVEEMSGDFKVTLTAPSK